MVIKTSEQIVSENLMAIGKRIYNYSPPLYINKDGLELIASSILLRWKEKRFLVTASHVMDDYKDQIGIFTNKLFLEVAGANVRSTRHDSSVDKIDIGAFALNESFLSQLGPDLDFYDLDQFNFDFDDGNGDEYLVVGHPIRRVKLKTKQRKIVLNPFVFQSKLSVEKGAFRSTNTTRSANFLVHYRRRKIRNLLTGAIVQGAMPEGLSGAGVWHFSDPIVDDPTTIQFYPTGIIVEYHNKYSSLVGTRIKIITELLRLNFDDTIPKSKTARVNTYL